MFPGSSDEDLGALPAADASAIGVSGAEASMPTPPIPAFVSPIAVLQQVTSPINEVWRNPPLPAQSSPLTDTDASLASITSSLSFGEPVTSVRRSTSVGWLHSMLSSCEDVSRSLSSRLEPPSATHGRSNSLPQPAPTAEPLPPAVPIHNSPALQTPSTVDSMTAASCDVITDMSQVVRPRDRPSTSAWRPSPSSDLPPSPLQLPSTSHTPTAVASPEGGSKRSSASLDDYDVADDLSPQALNEAIQTIKSDVITPLVKRELKQTIQTKRMKVFGEEMVLEEKQTPPEKVRLISASHTQTPHNSRSFQYYVFVP